MFVAIILMFLTGFGSPHAYSLSCRHHYGQTLLDGLLGTFEIKGIDPSKIEVHEVRSPPYFHDLRIHYDGVEVGYYRIGKDPMYGTLEPSTNLNSEFQGTGLGSLIAYLSARKLFVDEGIRSANSPRAGYTSRKMFGLLRVLHDRGWAVQRPGPVYIFTETFLRSEELVEVYQAFEPIPYQQN